MPMIHPFSSYLTLFARSWRNLNATEPDYDPFLFFVAWQLILFFMPCAVSLDFSAPLVSFHPPFLSFLAHEGRDIRKRERISLDRVARFSRATDIIVNEITASSKSYSTVSRCSPFHALLRDGYTGVKRAGKKASWFLSSNDAFVHYTLPKRPPLPSNCSLFDVGHDPVSFISSISCFYTAMYITMTWSVQINFIRTRIVSLILNTSIWLK